MSDQLFLSAPLDSPTGTVTNAIKEKKTLTIRTNLVFYRKILKHNPISNPLILRKGTDGKTADGRFDRTGKKNTEQNAKPLKIKRFVIYPKRIKVLI